MHTSPPPGTQGPDKAGAGGAEEGGRHSDQQAPFVPPSVAIYRRQTRAAFQGFHFSCKGVGGPQSEWGRGPRTFRQSEAQGVAPTEWGKVPNRAVESPCPGASVQEAGTRNPAPETRPPLTPGASGWKEALWQDRAAGQSPAFRSRPATPNDSGGSSG